MTNDKFSELFGEPVRMPESDLLTQFHMDVAASIQSVTEDIVLRITRSLAHEFDIPNLCLAGGVALNCVANGKILRDRAFGDVWIQPAAGDAGGAVGAALAYWHEELDGPGWSAEAYRWCVGEEASQRAGERGWRRVRALGGKTDAGSVADWIASQLGKA